jgi:hypothetical protein
MKKAKGTRICREKRRTTKTQAAAAPSSHHDENELRVKNP